MKLLIIRHGQSEADLLNVYEGRADFELTELGHEQAKQMSKFVNNNYKISKIYSSPLKRAVQTANYLSEETGAEIILDNKLMEFDNGLIAGLKKEVADAKYPMVMNIPIYTSVYEQETLMEFRLRADCFLSEIIKENSNNDVVAVITHGGMINQLYASFLRLPVDNNISFVTGDTGMHCWYIDDKSRRRIAANQKSI